LASIIWMDVAETFTKCPWKLQQLSHDLICCHYHLLIIPNHHVINVILMTFICILWPNHRFAPHSVIYCRDRGDETFPTRYVSTRSVTFFCSIILQSKAA
jgi:hypothetical protein